MSKRTKEELGTQAFTVPQPYGNYRALDENGKRMWDKIGQEIYNGAIEDAALMLEYDAGTSVYYENKKLLIGLAEQIRFLKVK